MRAYSPLRLNWDGTTDAGRARAGRAVPPARDAARRGPLGDRPEDDERRHPGAALRGLRRLPVHAIEEAQGNVISQGDREVKIYIKGVSPLYATNSGSSAPIRASRARSRAAEHPGRLAPARVGRASWTASRCTPGTYLVQSEVRDTAGNVGITPAEFEVGTYRGPARASPCAGSPPGRRCARSPRAGGPSSRSTRAARRTAGACAGWATRRCASAAARPRTCSPSARRRARRASTCSSCARAAGTPRSRSSCRPRSARACSWSCPTITWLGTDKVDDRPFDGLPNTLADGGTVRWPRVFVGDGRPAGRVRGRHRAAARLPRPPPHPVRPHE